MSSIVVDAAVGVSVAVAVALAAAGAEQPGVHLELHHLEAVRRADAHRVVLRGGRRLAKAQQRARAASSAASTPAYETPVSSALR